MGQVSHPESGRIRENNGENWVRMAVVQGLYPRGCDNLGITVRKVRITPGNRKDHRMSNGQKHRGFTGV